ncbi:MAG TPA: MFS transporter [Anaeromyxobacteraceae bacterium]|nr:MFS transporter [Anaeromyxobacteraceae bacterium]
MSPSSRLRLFYFLYYGSVGVYLPYFAAYLRGLGWSGERIGFVQMIAPLVAGPSAILWATYADRVGSPARVLAFASLWAACAVAFLPFVHVPLTVGAVLLAQALADRSIVPLVDSVTLEWVRTRRRGSYARIRLFGSLGFVALAQSVGVLLSLRGDRAGDVAVPVAMAACVFAYAVVARTLPSPPAADARPRLADTLGLLRDRGLAALFLACAIHWAACAPWHLMFGVFVRDERLPAALTGLGSALGVLAEVSVLLAFPRLERRYTARALLAVSFAGSAARWFMLSRAESPAAIVAIQLLHGLTFGAFWGAAVNEMARIVPARLRATGQALFSAVVFGAGNAVGYALAGAGYDRLGGARPLFACASAAELIALAVVALVVKTHGAPRR